MSLMKDVLQEVAVVQIGITQWIFGEVKMALIRKLLNIGLESMMNLKNFGNNKVANKQQTD